MTTLMSTAPSTVSVTVSSTTPQFAIWEKTVPPMVAGRCLVLSNSGGETWIAASKKNTDESLAAAVFKTARITRRASMIVVTAVVNLSGCLTNPAASTVVEMIPPVPSWVVSHPPWLHREVVQVVTTLRLENLLSRQLEAAPLVALSARSQEA